VWVPRVGLCFSAEDPFVFARRHVDAHANRARAESLLRYNLYIDCMPTEDIPPLSTEQVCSWVCTQGDVSMHVHEHACRLGHTGGLQSGLCAEQQEVKGQADGHTRTRTHARTLARMARPACPQVNRVLGFALNSKKLRDKLMDTNALLAEVNTDYARSMNKITFDSALKRGHSGCLAALVPIAEQFPQERRVCGVALCAQRRVCTGAPCVNVRGVACERSDVCAWAPCV